MQCSFAMIISGKIFSPGTIENIQRLADDTLGLSRREMSRPACEMPAWRHPDGALEGYELPQGTIGFIITALSVCRTLFRISHLPAVTSATRATKKVSVPRIQTPALKESSPSTVSTGLARGAATTPGLVAWNRKARVAPEAKDGWGKYANGRKALLAEAGHFVSRS